MQVQAPERTGSKSAASFFPSDQGVGKNSSLNRQTGDLFSCIEYDVIKYMAERVKGDEDMKIARIDVFALRLPMSQSFTISNRAASDASLGASHIYVRITADNGVCGWVEARLSTRWSYETL
ncbi:hypothetical protein [Paenibacillus thiaminolyticus]|uniref:hypothetical protein n=1 Tax=Paenibacillus thiaminolyticus TaxID=49283 RepID=UPI00217590B6|nr:hypothetical protein [Paenibacillus thiaminolyticus]